MKNKIGLLMMSLLVFVLVLVACGGNDDTSTGTGGGADNSETSGQVNEGNENVASEVEIPNIPGFPLAEPITVTMMGPHAGVSDWEDMALFHSLTEATNIHWEFITPSDQDFLTNLNLTFVTQELPDVFFGASLTAAHQMEHGSVGTLIPLQDLIADYAPNISSTLAEHSHITNSITAPDGNIYALPTINLGSDAIWPAGPVYYNGQWLDLLEAEVPRTLDEFTELMFRFRDEIPELIGVDHVFPISATDEMVWLRTWIISFWGMATRAVEATDGNVVHNATTEAYRAYLEWMHMAFNEGLIHPEIFTLSGDMHNALGRENRIGLFQSWHSYGFLGTDAEQALRNPMLRPLTSEWSPEGVLPRSPGFSLGQFAITSRAEHPEAIMMLMDWFYSEEGALFADHGPEGAFWVYDTHEETGEQVRVLAPGVDPEDGAERGRFTPFFGFPAPQIITATPNPRILIDRYQTLEDPLNDFLREETMATMYAYGKVPMPPAMLTEDEVHLIQTTNADLNMEINRQEAAFVTGLTPLNDETWAAFQATLETIGVQDVVDVWQAAHNRWLAASQ